MCAGHHGESVTYGGLTIHKPERWQVMWGEGLAGLMWCAADCILAAVHALTSVDFFCARA